MKVGTIGSLLAKLLLAMLAFPPIYIVAKYLRWCSKHKCSDQKSENESAE